LARLASYPTSTTPWPNATASLFLRKDIPIAMA
jgi:hypothetical protein